MSSPVTLGLRSTCYYCGIMGPTTRDHFWPKSKGGRGTVWACCICQKLKTDLLPNQWVAWVKNSPNFSDQYKERIEASVKTLCRQIVINGTTYEQFTVHNMI